MRSATGWGVIFLGTLIMGVGYVLSRSTRLDIGRMGTVAFGNQLQEIGFMLVAGGIVAWFIISILTDLRIV
jgi:hypothetical protein